LGGNKKQKLFGRMKNVFFILTWHALAWGSFGLRAKNGRTPGPVTAQSPSHPNTVDPARVCSAFLPLSAFGGNP